MRVLLLGKIPPIQGGVSRSTWLAACDFLDAGHSIEVISNADAMDYGFRQMTTASDKELEVFRKRGGVIHNLESVPPYSYIPWSSPFLSQMLGAGIASIRRAAPDVIVGWYLEPYGVAASILGKMFNVPVILRHAGSDIGRLRNVTDLGNAYDAFLSEAAAVITGKSAQTDEILREAGVKPHAMFKVKGRALHRSFFEKSDDFDLHELVDRSEEWFSHYGFDEDLYRKLIEWNRAALDNDEPAIGTYGKIAEVKGTYNIIDAIDSLAGRGVKVSYRALWSATPKRFAHAFRYLSAKKNLRGRSMILPPLAPWRVPAFIKSCQGVAFLENRFPISFHTPQVPREVIACASPLILSGEIYEKVYFGSQLVDRINVLKVEDPQEPAQLEAAIAELLASPELRKCLIHHARALSRILEARTPVADPIVEIAEGLLQNDDRTKAVA